MSLLMAIVKEWCLPGSLPFLFCGLGVGVGLLFAPPRLATWGRRWLLGLVAGYWLCSLPIGADVLSAVLAGNTRPLLTAAEAHGAPAVVVLDAATDRHRAAGLAIDAPNAVAALRALEAIRVYRLLGDPLVVVTSGAETRDDPSSLEGAALRDAIVRGGVPEARVLLDSASPNTRAHATAMASALGARGITRIVLVTSPTHIRRAVLTFQAAGFDVVPSPAQSHSSDATWRWTNITPRPAALAVSAAAIRDAAALAYYLATGVLERKL